MSLAAPRALNFAKRLYLYETEGKKLSKTPGLAAFQACEKLRPVLVTLMGTAGFRALLLRALALASAEVSWLGAVSVKPGGALEGLENAQGQLGPDSSSKGEVVLLAQLLGLLMAFIGENLTLRLVRETWPQAPFHDLDIGEGDNNEKAK